MSSSFLKAGTGALFFLSISSGPATLAAETYFIPRVDASAEWNSNREMIVDPQFIDASTAYRLLLEGRIGWVTPRSDTELRPRVVVQEFPDRAGIDPVSAYLDLRSIFRTLKGLYWVLGSFSQVDTYTSEYGQAAFPDFDPNAPEVPDTGIVLFGKTRTVAQVEPRFEYELSERNGLKGGLEYENVRYDTAIPGSNVGYENWGADFMFTRDLVPQTELGFGPYAAHYESGDGRNKTDSYGATIELVHDWNATSNTRVSVNYERSDTTYSQPVRTEASINSWGFEVSGLQRNRVGSVRYRIGRYLQPTSFGERRTTDQLRVQYNRPLTVRTYFDGAVRLSRQQRLNGLVGDVNDRVLAELTLGHALTRNWTVSIGYQYARSEHTTGSTVADNNGVVLRLIYRGSESKEVRRSQEDVPR